MRIARSTHGMFPRSFVLSLLLTAAAAALARAGTAQVSERAAVDFGREVRPILADRCFRCHGPDEHARKRGLRLDGQAGSRAVLKSGARAIVPGERDESEMFARISSGDPNEVMPPPELGRPLSQEQKETLARWIDEGGEYRAHWAFVAPVKAPLPEVRDAGWCRDELDRFVLARLEAEGLEHAPEAERATLLRRVTLALTGLPPPPEETAAFLGDSASDAYERAVDRLLASPQHAERMAADWLDVARFADTFGYQSDWECHMWPWRDWLIRAFEQNLPYDEFVREQIAGDLLPGATSETRLATAFNRLHRMTNEGGSIDAEFRQEYVSDRVVTASTAFLGLTVECARCHDHKYDPIPQQDYYSLCAFFGAIDEAGTYAYSTGATPPPTLRLPTREQEEQLARADREVQIAEMHWAGTRAAASRAFPLWLRGAPTLALSLPARHYPLDGAIEGPSGKATALDGDSGPAFDDVAAFRRCDPYTLAFWMRCPDAKARATVLHTSNFTLESDQQGYQVMLEDGRLAWQVIHFWPGSAIAIRTSEAFPLGRWVHVAVTYDGSSRAAGLAIYVDGELAPIEVVRDHLDGPALVRSFQVGFRSRDLGFAGGAVDELLVFDRALSAPEVAEIFRPGALAATCARGEDAAGLEDFYARNVDEECRAAALALREARAAYQDILEAIPEIMVMQETAWPRASYILRRGAYDQPDLARPVHPDRAIEAILPYDPTWPQNRLGLALWLTDPRNPLLARVEVNRLWAICFGRGIVPTQENFGQQGEAPSHPELLDALAVDFVASGWDVRGLLRRIVLSSTFRQDSAATAASLEKDPTNRLASRGPAYRLSAEMLRDQALAAAGLLEPAVGGPSVKPWQPPGLWEDSGANAQGNGAYVPDEGAAAHRRSLYTYRKRTAPPPNMLVLDAGSREQCLARRQPTNTPLQNLVFWNDQVFFECARSLAQRSEREAANDPDARIERVFRLLAAREPRSGERTVLRALYDAELALYEGDGDASRAVLASTEPDPELAALTLVCSTLLAADVVITNR